MNLKCKDCQERYINCHIYCEAYQDFKKEREFIRREKEKRFKYDRLEENLRRKRERGKFYGRNSN